MLSVILKDLRNKNSYTQQEVADILGMKRTTYSMYESKRAIPDIRTVVKLAELYRVSTDFILGVENSSQPNCNESKLFNLFNSADQKSREIALFALKIGQNSNIVEFPTFDIDHYADSPVSAGTGYWMDETRKEKLKLKKAPPQGASYVCNISGDSMEPLFSDGDKIFVAAAPVISLGDVGIFIYENEAYIKRAGEGCLLSENPAYPPIIIKDSDRLFCIGTVLGKCDDTYLK